MTKRLDISRVLLAEGIIWFFILCIVLFSIRAYCYKQQKQTKQYQIFVSDIDSLIVGSPVKYMGVPVGYISYIKLLGNEVYVKFVIDNKDIELPKGVVANVEFNGMGGTKSLELYPPTEQDLKTEKIINIKDTVRLSGSISMFNDMMGKIALIQGKTSYFAKQIMPMIEFQTTDNFEKFLKNYTETNEKLKNMSLEQKKH